MTPDQLNQQISALEDTLEHLYVLRSEVLQREGIYLCVGCNQIQVNPHDGYDSCELCARLA